MKLVKKILSSIIITGLSANTAFAKTTVILKADPVKTSDIVVLAQSDIKAELDAIKIDVKPIIKFESSYLAAKVTEKVDSQTVEKQKATAE